MLPSPVNAPVTPAPERIADALVLIQEAWTSLAVQRQYGRLERDWLMYRRLAECFGRVVLVSSGGPEDIGIGAELAPNVSVVCNDKGLEPVHFLGSAPGRVRDMLGLERGTGDTSVLVKTDQLCSAGTALDVLAALRGDAARLPARRVGLLARGGYHWSWTVAREHGGDSPKAIQAGHDEEELLRHADLVQVTTDKIAFDLRWRFALPDDRVRVVPNFVHVPDGPYMKAPPRRAGERVILSAGRLSREKRVHLLIEGFAQLPENLQKTTRLRVVGSGPMEGELRDRAQRLRVLADKNGGGIEFVGRLPHGELVREMGECRVYAQMSEYEGHPKTILEAMAAGAAVLAADAPGIREHVVDGRTGLLSAGDANAVGEKMHLLLTDDRLTERLGACAAEETRRLLSLERVLPMEIESCREAMRRAHHAPAEGTRPFAAVVRWSPSLLKTPPEAAAKAFATSIAAYAKRLGAEHAAQFREALNR